MSTTILKTEYFKTFYIFYRLLPNVRTHAYGNELRMCLLCGL